MNDLSHWWGNDLAVAANGDLLIASPSVTGEQRVLRRLMTNPQLVDVNGLVQVSGDYIFAPTYGAGLPRMVGLPVDISTTTGTVAGQLAQEQAVSNLPVPVVQISPIQDGVNAFIEYNDAASLTTVTLDFDVTN